MASAEPENVACTAVRYFLAYAIGARFLLGRLGPCSAKHTE